MPELNRLTNVNYYSNVDSQISQAPEPTPFQFYKVLYIVAGTYIYVIIDWTPNNERPIITYVKLFQPDGLIESRIEDSYPIWYNWATTGMLKSFSYFSTGFCNFSIACHTQYVSLFLIVCV